MHKPADRSDHIVNIVHKEQVSKSKIFILLGFPIQIGLKSLHYSHCYRS